MSQSHRRKDRFPTETLRKRRKFDNGFAKLRKEKRDDQLHAFQFPTIPFAFFLFYLRKTSFVPTTRKTTPKIRHQEKGIFSPPNKPKVSTAKAVAI